MIMHGEADTDADADGIHTKNKMSAHLRVVGDINIQFVLYF